MTALLITVRRPRSRFCLFVSATLVLRAVGFAGGLPDLALRDAAWAVPVDLVRSLDGIFVLLFLYVFPDGHFVSRWTSNLWLVWTAWVAATLPFPAFSPILTGDLAWAAPVLVLVAASGLVAQVYRYRRVATPHERLQTKWISYGIALYVAVFAVTTLLKIALPEVRVVGSPANLMFVVASGIADDLAASAAAAAIAIAILRRQLLEIDVIVNRTLVYLAATRIIAGVFAAVSTGVQRLVIEITGPRSSVTDIVIALGVGASFGTVKAYVQTLVNRRLRRG